jgi:hydroxymethylpyrimidine pyrophosphatase-like HAD family hydrolase
MTPAPRFPATKIAAVLSEVDGTLVTDNKISTARAQAAAVAEFHARGIIFTIISSRPPRGLRMLLEPLKITTPIGSFNGGVITTSDLAVIEPKPREIVANILSALNMAKDVLPPGYASLQPSGAGA